MGNVPSQSRKARWFLMLALGPPLLLLLGAPLVVRSNWFAAGDKNGWVRQLDYSYDVRGIDADVVVFSDSTAMNGVDPRLIERDTGVRAVVLPNNVHAMNVMHDKPLAFYLSHNKPPRLIVIYLAPWETGAPQQTIWPEGLIMLLRHDSLANIVRFFVSHPAQVLSADITLVPIVLRRFLQHSVTGPAAYPAIAGRGFAPNAGAKTLAAGCSLLADHKLQADAGLLPRQMIQRWQSATTKVVLYLAPIPNCNGASQFAAMSLEPRQIAGPAMLPPSQFVDDYFQVHPEARFVPISTRLFEDAIRGIN